MLRNRISKLELGRGYSFAAPEFFTYHDENDDDALRAAELRTEAMGVPLFVTIYEPRPLK